MRVQHSSLAKWRKLLLAYLEKRGFRLLAGFLMLGLCSTFFSADIEAALRLPAQASTPGSNGIAVLMLPDPQVNANSAEVLSSGALDASNKYIEVVLLWRDTSNYYSAVLDGNTLSLVKKVGGVTSKLASIGFSAQTGVSYTLRFQISGGQLAAKAWRSDQAEPRNWMITATDRGI